MRNARVQRHRLFPDAAVAVGRVEENHAHACETIRSVLAQLLVVASACEQTSSNARWWIRGWRSRRVPAEPLEEVMDNSSDWNGSGNMGPPGEKKTGNISIRNAMVATTCGSGSSWHSCMVWLSETDCPRTELSGQCILMRTQNKKNLLTFLQYSAYSEPNLASIHFSSTGMTCPTRYAAVMARPTKLYMESRRSGMATQDPIMPM